MEARLITIPLSHYCEKARWVLDFTGVDYREEAHAPVAHLRATRGVGGKTVPVLVHGEKVLRDSTDIAKHADALAPPERRLIPDDPAMRARVLALEDELDETLGVDARLLTYWFQLGNDANARALVGRMMRLRSPLAQSIASPIFRAFVFRKYRVSEGAARVAEARVRATFAKLGESLRDDGYLVGDRFTLADLTFAALASLLLGPPEHPIMGRNKVALLPEVAARRAELSATAAGKHALRVYQKHRGAPTTLST